MEDNELKNLALELMSNYCIRSGGKEFNLVEIEFYRRDEEGTYKRKWKERLFYHYSGLDICLEHKGTFWGVLVRSVEVNGTFIGGPLKVKNVILNSMTYESPTFIELAKPKKITLNDISSSTRIGFSEQTKQYRFVITEIEKEYMAHNKERHTISYKKNIKQLDLQ